MARKIFIYGASGQRSNYCLPLAALGAEPVVSLQPKDALGCCGLLLTGGGDLDPAWYGQVNTDSRSIEEATDLAELYLTLAFLRQGRPILGICRGLQVLNVALGGTLCQHIEGHSGDEKGDRLHQTTAAGLLRTLYGPSPTVNSWHHQAVLAPGDGLQVVQRAEDGTIEALQHSRLLVLGVQWHPERLWGAFARPEAVDGGRLLAWFLAQCEHE